MSNVIASAFLKELEMEERATYKCVERIPESLFSYKPHSKSMELGYLAQLVAAIPLWITTMIEKGEIDFVTFPRPDIKTNVDLVKYFTDNFAGAQKALQDVTDEDLQKPFSLKSDGQTVFTASREDNIRSTLNHWVHHRGQLTVYMRLNDIDVPSIYGPSADDQGF